MMEEIRNAKKNLQTILKDNHFDTKNSKVHEAIEELSNLWKKQETPNAPSESEHIQGTWKIISAPEFPGRIPSSKPEIFQYSLGRMSFNVFEPRNAVVTISDKEVYNIIEKFDTEQEGNEEKSSYNILTNIKLHIDGIELPAELFMEGYCTPKTDTRLTVGFFGGTLRKSPLVNNDESLLKLWNKTFENVYSKADEDRRYTEILMRWIMKTMMKMVMPTDESMRYEMKRVVQGHLDILYMDEDLRITKGNRGTVIVVVKDAKNSS